MHTTSIKKDPAGNTGILGYGGKSPIFKFSRFFFFILKLKLSKHRSALIKNADGSSVNRYRRIKKRYIFIKIVRKWPALEATLPPYFRTKRRKERKLDFEIRQTGYESKAFFKCLRMV